MLSRLFFTFICSTVVLSAAENFKMDMFPMVFMRGEPFGIVENLPSMVHVRAWACTEKDKKEFGKQTPVLLMDLPEFLKFAGAQQKMADYTPWRALKVTKTSLVQHDGMKYRRYEVPYYYGNTSWNNRLGVKAPHYANNLQVYWQPEKGSAGKKAKIYAQVQFGKKITPVYSYPVEIISPVKPVRKTSKYFEVLLPAFPGQEGHHEDLVQIYADYWCNLTEKVTLFHPIEIFGISKSLQKKVKLDHSINSGKTLPGLATPYYNESGFQAWRKLVISKRVPTLILEDGKPFRNATIDAPVWYYLEDPEKLYENYLAKGFRSYKEHYPELRRFYWDYEPGTSGYDDKGRALFAKEMKLDKVPTLHDLTKGKYVHQWFRYQIGLHQKHLEKVVRIFRRELPGREFWICTDPLHAKGPNPSYWCAVNNLLADKVVDGHKSMPYYSGLRYFEDIRYNREKLKKPIIPLNDPAEREKRFFVNYTPALLAQNILATAAVGCQGFGFWPDFAFTGEYYHKFSQVWSLIAQAEEFYYKGTKADSEVSVEYCNTVKTTLPYGKNKTKTISVPDFSQTFRYLVHKRNGEYVVTLLNYDSKNPVFIRLNFKNAPAEFTVSEFDGVRYTAKAPVIKIEPNGLKVVKFGKQPVTQKLADSKKIEADLKQNIRHSLGNTRFAEIRKDGASASWLIPERPMRPMLQLKNAKGQSIRVDVYGVQTGIVSWTHAFSPRLLGQIMLFDQSRIAAPYHFVLKNYYANANESAAEFEYVFQTQDAGEAFTLQDLKITQKFAILKDGRIMMRYTLTNGSDHAVTTGFRVQNIPFWKNESISAGSFKVEKKHINQEFLLVRKGAKTTYYPALKRSVWDGKPVRIVRAPKYDLKVDAPDFAGVYIFAGSDFGTVTVEPVTSGFTLKPGESRSFTLFAQY